MLVAPGPARGDAAPPPTHNALPAAAAARGRWRRPAAQKNDAGSAAVLPARPFYPENKTRGVLFSPFPSSGTWSGTMHPGTDGRDRLCPSSARRARCHVDATEPQSPCAVLAAPPGHPL
ncbi:unnamed protein product [Coccothraustes coccothraustes]